VVRGVSEESSVPENVEAKEDVDLKEIDGGSMTVADLKRMTAESEYGSFTLRTLPVPISLFQALGVEEGASIEEVAAGFRSRQEWDASKADEGAEYLSKQCLAARAEVVQVANTTLSNPELRGEYEETVRRGDEFVSLDFEQVPGALLLMLEYGAYRKVAKAGKAALLDERVGKCPPEVELDLRLLTSLAVLDQARGKLEEGKAASCCTLLDEALGYLEGDKMLGETPLAPGLQANLVGSLQQIIPARGLEYLALPLEAKGSPPTSKRFEGLACIKDYIVRHVIEAPKEGAVSREQALVFVVEAFSHMTASEQIDLYRALTVKDTQALPEELVLLVGRAYLAEGYATSRPRLVEFAAELLSGLDALRGNVHAELAACSLLLGLTMEASRLLQPWLSMASLASGLVDLESPREPSRRKKADSSGGKAESPLDRNAHSLRDPVLVHASTTADLDEFARTQVVLEAWLARNLLAGFRETWEVPGRAFHSMLTYFFHPRSRKEFADLASDAAPWDGTGKMLTSPLTGLAKLARWMVVAALALPRTLLALGWTPLEDLQYRIKGTGRASALRSAKPPSRVNQDIAPLEAAALEATDGTTPSTSSGKRREGGKGKKVPRERWAWPIPKWITVGLGIFLVWYAAGMGADVPAPQRSFSNGTVRKYEKYESRRVYTSGSGGRSSSSLRASRREVVDDSILGGMTNAVMSIFRGDRKEGSGGPPQRVAAHHTIAAALVVGVLSQLVDMRFGKRRTARRSGESAAP